MARMQRVKKRDGTIVPFDRQKIEQAIFRAALEVLQDAEEAASDMAPPSSQLPLEPPPP